MIITIFGMGYVGLVTAVSFAEHGHEVLGVESNAEKSELINSGVCPLVEPSLAELIAQHVKSGRLRICPSVNEAVNQSDLAFITVGTPPSISGYPNLGQVEKVAVEIGRSLRNRQGPLYTIVLRSTVLPGTVEKILLPLLEQNSKTKLGQVFKVAFNPEFLREGTALNDFNNPPFTILGELPSTPADEVFDFWSEFNLDAKIFRMTIQTAELLKYVCNIFHALKITFANEIGQIAKVASVNPIEVMELFKQDHILNISEKYLTPGFAFGGSCLTKDIRALLAFAIDADVSTPVLSQILNSNQAHIERAVNEILLHNQEPIGIVGLTFKPDTDDVRESPTIYIAKILQDKGVDLYLWDNILDPLNIHGANLDFINNKVNNLEKIWLTDFDVFLEKVNTFVIHHPKDFKIFKSKVKKDKSIINLPELL